MLTHKDGEKYTFPLFNGVVETSDLDDSSSPIQKRRNVLADASTMERGGFLSPAQMVS